MKILFAAVLVTILGLGLAATSFAECAQHKTATAAPPGTPAPSTAKT
jgi:hypothetical protein